jgi:opacity protein-like surface antigen
MNKILKLSAIALLASSTSLMAQSKSFEGVSLGITASVVGAEVSGSTSTNTNSANSSSGSIGKVTEIAAIDLSYAFATSANTLISVGANYIPGKAKLGGGTFTDGTNLGLQNEDSTTSTSASIKDPYTIYIAPTYAISKDAALYVKVGYSHADINVSSTGTERVTSSPSTLEGWTYAIGSKTMLTPNTYFGVEASVTDYDNISATLTNGKTVSANPKVAQGTIALGYKF